MTIEEVAAPRTHPSSGDARGSAVAVLSVTAFAFAGGLLGPAQARAARVYTGPAAVAPEPGPRPARAYGAPARADGTEPGGREGERGESDDPNDPIRRTIEVGAQQRELELPDRAATLVSQQDFEERQPQSSPDALRFEPGVYIQQTAHGQGSPYVRGLTGQRLLLGFDGIRLNTSLYRQGPNQYLFTVDVRTIDHYEIVRGPAAVRYGSDGLAGAVLASPVVPTMVQGDSDWEVHPRVILKTATADTELGGRAQVDVSYKGKLGFFGGAGYRDVGLLRAAGPIIDPATNMPFRNPLFGPDGRTQNGTGFREFAYDGRLAWQARKNLTLSLAHYDYRQFDAPRTDKCPAPTAVLDECLIYDELFKSLTYFALDADEGPAFAERVRMRVSLQRSHERRRYDYGSLPFRQYENIGRDRVYTIGTTLRLRSKTFALAKPATLTAEYGVDQYADTVDSKAWTILLDTDKTIEHPRGQYVAGSFAYTGGMWGQLRFNFWDRVGLRMGGRLALSGVYVPGEEESETTQVDRNWSTFVGEAGLSIKATKWLTLLLGVDQGFRAPNLDDVSSRQQIGPGFQLENPDLVPERSNSVDAGLKIEHDWVTFSGHVFQLWIDDMIERAPGICPATGVIGDGCSASQTVLQLVNLRDTAVVRGFDGVVRFRLPLGFGLRSTVAYAWGEGPNPVPGSTPERLPLSRIPPLNGTVELSWHERSLGFLFGAALRWQALQDRLALQDTFDPRIPMGGTPGFAVVDLRAVYRWRPFVLASVVLENLMDTPFRTHGSGINGPGRGVRLQVEFGF